MYKVESGRHKSNKDWSNKKSHQEGRNEAIWRPGISSLFILHEEYIWIDLENVDEYSVVEIFIFSDEKLEMTRRLRIFMARLEPARDLIEDFESYVVNRLNIRI